MSAPAPDRDLASTNQAEQGSSALLASVRNKQQSAQEDSRLQADQAERFNALCSRCTIKAETPLVGVGCFESKAIEGGGGTGVMTMAAAAAASTWLVDFRVEGARPLHHHPCCLLSIPATLPIAQLPAWLVAWAQQLENAEAAYPRTPRRDFEVQPVAVWLCATQTNVRLVDLLAAAAAAASSSSSSSGSTTAGTVVELCGTVLGPQPITGTRHVLCVVRCIKQDSV